MKTPLLIAAFVLLFSATLQAQSKASERSGPGGPSKNESGSVANPDPNGDIMLPPGNLRAIVHYIEEELMPHWMDHIGTMPNILLTEEAGDCEIPGPLKLHRVTPVQAVALAAAAVDCTMEPVFGPLESTDPRTPPAVIGYRIERSKTPKAGSGTVSILGTGAAAGTASAAKAEEDPRQQMVRVYAIGAAHRTKGGEPLNRDEIERQEEKTLLDLVGDAMEKAGLVQPEPQLTIHAGSRALVVKATAAQQDIVREVVQAIKESRESEARAEASAKH